ncbi:MAG: hypothetical protein MZW92_71675 [Comamonadaceae bacterium]|nr:hypothetical protein [Comamonadaceae bacterium]
MRARAPARARAAAGDRLAARGAPLVDALNDLLARLGARARRAARLRRRRGARAAHAAHRAATCRRSSPSARGERRRARARRSRELQRRAGARDAARRAAARAGARRAGRRRRRPAPVDLDGARARRRRRRSRRSPRRAAIDLGLVAPATPVRRRRRRATALRTLLAQPRRQRDPLHAGRRAGRRACVETARRRRCSRCRDDRSRHPGRRARARCSTASSAAASADGTGSGLGLAHRARASPTRHGATVALGRRRPAAGAGARRAVPLAACRPRPPP